jgi:putative proteasome-type protease
MLVRQGLVVISDSRTNAGIDNINTFRKLHLFERPGEAAMALAVAGNLSITQSVVNMVTEGLKNPETGEVETLLGSPSMFKAAQLVGRAMREVSALDGDSLERHGGHFDAQILLGGQLKDRRLRLFLIYSAGNFIEASSDTPFLQIGELKYGKPILDRAVTFETELYAALKLGLISMDSTMRSNLAVGLPIDLAILPRDALRVELSHRIEPGDEYFENLRHRWSEALRATHQAIPRPPYTSTPGR